MMNRANIVLLAVILLMSSGALATDVSSDLALSATISASCRVNSGALNFNTYDPTGIHATAPLDRSGTFRLTCTNGTPATVKLGQGNNPGDGSTDAAPLRRMEGDVGIYLRYDVYQDAGRTTAWGNTTGTGRAVTGTGTQATLTVYGRVLPGQLVPVGTYSDTITVTVSF
jgi:spore coat protein U-like protein